jgi:lipoprotein LpqB-like beta-propeller protein/sporulation and spore germination protein
VTRVLAVLLGLVLMLSRCTGVPGSSTPQVVRTVADGGQDQPQELSTPAPGVVPKILVQNFLAVSSSDAGRHASARTFLTPAARSSWTDSTVTVVASTPSVGSYTPGKPVVASAVQLGTVSNGIYSPSLQTGRAPRTQFTFGISTVGGQYRINTLRNGLILTEQQFVDSFVPRSLYFFDLAHRYLVPDLRWTPDDDPLQASEVLVNLLAAGPNPTLQNAVNTDSLPAQAGTRHINVTGGDPVRIEIAGSAQLASGAKNRLAAQIAATLADVDRGRSLQISDGGTPVTVPAAGAKEFSSSDFSDATVTPQVPEVYYLRGGQIVDQNRQLVKGPLNYGRYPLTSLAVTRSGSGGDLTVAGVTALNGTDRLVIGSQTSGLRRTTVVGVTSRPAFAPGRVEAWVGAGSTIYRTVLFNGRITSTAVPLPTAQAGSRVVALRLSPEGSRIAVVLRNQAGRQQLLTGAVVRSSSTQVQIEQLQQISPNDVTVTDVAWIEGERLNAIGFDSETQDPHVYRTGADGSAWTEYGIGELPGPPSTLAGAPGAPAWTASGSDVFVQVTPTTWLNPGPGAALQATSALGSAPTYVE